VKSRASKVGTRTSEVRSRTRSWKPDRVSLPASRWMDGGAVRKFGLSCKLVSSEKPIGLMLSGQYNEYVLTREALDRLLLRHPPPQAQR
jgi:hypothetical protein